MHYFISILGIIIVLAIAWGISNKKKSIRYQPILIMILGQLLLTWFMLGTTVGLNSIQFVSGGFAKLIDYAKTGVDFVVGGWVPAGGVPFFVTALMPIIFTSALLSLLNHIKILPIVIKYIGGFVSKATGLPKVESFNAVNSVFFGQSEALLAIKNHLPKMEKNRLFIVCLSAMSSVSASIIASYMTIIPAEYVLSGMMLNMLGGLIIGSIAAPIEKDTVKDEAIEIDELVTTNNVFDAISAGALDGGKVVLIVSAMLVAYLGLLDLLDGIVSAIAGISMTNILGYVFSPIAFIMGIPANETLQAGSVMATKLLANEFAAILKFQPMMEKLSARTIGIVSTFLTSFGAVGSIGIISGTIQAIDGAKAKEVSKFGLKMLLASILVSILSGTIVGLFL